MANEWQLGLIAGLDGTKSKSQLNSDINGLARQLDKLKLYAEIDQNQVTQLQNQLKKLQIELNNVTVSDSVINGLVNKINAGLQNVNIRNINVDNVNRQARQIGQQIGEQINQGVQQKIDFTSNLSIAKNELEKLKATSKGYPEFLQTINSLDNAFSTVTDVSSLKEFTNQLKVARAELSRIKVEASAVNRNEKVGINVSGLQSQIAELQRISPEIDKFETKINGAKVTIRSLLADLNNVNTQGDFSVINSKWKAFTDAAKSAGIAITEIDSKSDAVIPASQKRINNLANAILSFKNNNSAMSKELSKNLDVMYSKLINGANLSEAELKELEIGFTSLKLQVREAGDLGKSFGAKLKDNVENFMSWGFATGLTTRGLQIIHEMYNALYEIDTAMTNLYKVTDETDEKYNAFLMEACGNAQELARSVSGLVEQTANWAKLGYSIDESAELAKVSSVYANVGEVDDDTAVADLVTAMRAFKLEASDAISIVDKFNAIGNQYAVSSADLGEGLSNSASSLALAGNTIDESLAMITAMTEITQSASESGNALKVFSMRVRGYDEETESFTNNVEELSGKIADLTKTAETPGGISLFTDDTKETYKSTYQLVNEISKIWDNLSDKNQANNICLYVQKCA